MSGRPQDTELSKILWVLFDDGRIAYANDKSPAVCDQYIDRAKTAIQSLIDTAVVAELENLYAYSGTGTRVKTLLGNRIAELTATDEGKRGTSHQHQWSTAGGYDDMTCDICGVSKP